MIFPWLIASVMLQYAARRSAFLCLGTFLLFVPMSAQETPGHPDQDAPPPQPQIEQLATVHGVVRNATSGEPLPRALVRIDGDATMGVLTDGDGHFEIPNVPLGPQQFEVIKPGFLDESYSVADDVQNFILAMSGVGHNVIVASEMPDVNFNLSPANSIQGQIELSTGDPAQGMNVVLLRRMVQNGRFTWSVMSNTKANSEGVYRFGGLPDGQYKVYTNPALDSELATNEVAAGRTANVKRSGYAAQFYPEARDAASAATIRVSGGEQAQGNFSLALEPFRAVSAIVTFPGGKQGLDALAHGPSGPVTVEVCDEQGNQMPYPAQYDPATHTAQAFLPDGNYTMVVVGAGVAGLEFTGAGRPSLMINDSLVGAASISVKGHAVDNVRIPLAAVHPSSVEVSEAAGSARPVGFNPNDGNGHQVFLTASQDGGWLMDGIVTSYAEGPVSGPLQAQFTKPGRYWIHTNVADKQFCESALTAGGSSLAREPLVVGVGAGAERVSLALRSDCATLTVSLPGLTGLPPAGEELFYTVYVVPDFDSTADVVPETLRASNGGKVTLTGLTPGGYHVYAFDRPVEIPYHDANAIAVLASHSQAVTLAPNAEANLVLEVPQH